MMQVSEQTLTSYTAVTIQRLLTVLVAVTVTSQAVPAGRNTTTTALACPSINTDCAFNDIERVADSA